MPMKVAQTRQSKRI